MAQHADQGMNKNEGPHWNWKSLKNLLKTGFFRDTSNELPLYYLNTADTALNTNQSKKQSPNESTETEVLY